MPDLRRLSVALIFIGALTGCGGDSPGSQAGAAAVANQLQGTGQGGTGAGSSQARASATDNDQQNPGSSHARRILFNKFEKIYCNAAIAANDDLWGLTRSDEESAPAHRK